MIAPTEKLIDNAAARKVIHKRTGRRPDLSTIFRWQMHGQRGIRLEHVRLGRKIFTSEKAIDRWMAALARVALDQRDQPDTNTSTRHADAERELDAAGV